MLNSIRKFAKTKLAYVFVFIIAVPFVLWGMGDVFSGNKNNLAKINNVNISTQDYIDYLNQTNIEKDSLSKNINNNIFEELLGELISEKLLDLEIKSFKIFVSERILAERIKNNKKFLDENNNFSRIKYEKFLLSNNLTAPGFEKRLKKNELQNDLFKYISGGIKTPFFLTNKTYKNETRNIDIKYINLEKIYKSKDRYTIKEIENYIYENEKELKKDFLNFSYAKITPKNLINSNEYNNEFFAKIDDIEDKISQNFGFNEIINQYKLTKKSKKNFIPINKKKSIENQIYNLRKNNSMMLIDQSEYFLLFEIEKIDSKLPEINEVSFLENVKNLLFQKKKYEYNRNLLEKIQKKNFTDSDFKRIVNNDQSKIEKITFNSIKDNKKFSIDSVKIIYSLPLNSFVLIVDDETNVYLAKILKENVKDVKKNSQNLKLFEKQSNSILKNELYTSYDNFLNNKYKIKINEKTLQRVKNYFK